MNPAESDALLLQAMRRVLRPLVRLSIRRNVPLQAFTQLLKEIYVAVAAETLCATQARVSDSQISLMTGVHRKDVRELRHLPVAAERDMPHVSVGAEIIARWLGNGQFRNTEGRPYPLPYANDSNPAFSFCALAGAVSSDVHPRAILEEMLRQNIVRYNEVTDQVWMNTEAFVPQVGWAEKLFYFGRHCEDHLEAAVANILSGKPPYLDRAVYYDGLTADSAAELKALAEESAMKALRAVNRRAHQLSEQDKDDPGARARINFGTYFFSDSVAPHEKE